MSVENPGLGGQREVRDVLAEVAGYGDCRDRHLVGNVQSVVRDLLGLVAVHYVVGGLLSRLSSLRLLDHPVVPHRHSQRRHPPRAVVHEVDGRVSESGRDVRVEEEDLEKVGESGLVVQSEVGAHDVAVLGEVGNQEGKDVVLPGLEGEEVPDEVGDLVEGEEGLQNELVVLRLGRLVGLEIEPLEIGVQLEKRGRPHLLHRRRPVLLHQPLRLVHSQQRQRRGGRRERAAGVRRRGGDRGEGGGLGSGRAGPSMRDGALVFLGLHVGHG